jgi:hypothetical protein
MDIQETENTRNNQSEEISAKELLLRIQSWIKFIISKWMTILIFLIIGISCGFYMYKKSVTTYIADCTFTLDEGNSDKSNSMGGLALLGIGGTSEGGLFQGKNLIWLYTSRQMLEKALLSKIVVNNKEQLYIDWFLSVDNVAKKMKNIKGVRFPSYSDSLNLSAEQNGLLSFAIGRIKDKYLVVDETKNAEGLITVTIKSENELFAKKFSDNLVSTVNGFYIDSKTKKIRNEIAILENKTKGYQEDMNTSMYQTASAYDATPYPNPNQQVLQVNAQKKSVGIKINSELYTEMVRILEQNKMSLAKETPLIQVIDEPTLPLPASKLSFITVLVYSIIISGFVSVLILTLIKAYRSIINS